MNLFELVHFHKLIQDGHIWISTNLVLVVYNVVRMLSNLERIFYKREKLLPDISQKSYLREVVIPIDNTQVYTVQNILE